MSQGTRYKPKQKRFHPNPRDDPLTQSSRALAYVLRHGAEKEGINIRPDGYVRVNDLLASPKFSALNFETLQKIVDNDPKKRYNLAFEPIGDDTSTDNLNAWFMRASQGHSLPVVQIVNEPILSAAGIPMAVHGSYLTAWPSICKSGISRMDRTHIHLSQGVDEDVISGIRSNVDILIFINLQKAIDAGYAFEMSSNGVILTKGNEHGLILPEFFERVEKVITRRSREPMLHWNANTTQMEDNNKTEVPDMSTPP